MNRKLLIMMAALPAIASVCATALASPAVDAFNADGMERILARERGRPFVLLLWSLDCTFCHASMKNLATAQNREGFDVAAVAIETADDPANAAAISAATSQLGKNTSVWAFGDEAPERLRYLVDPAWHGELPRSYWYDAMGQRLAAHSGLITPSYIVEVRHKITGEPASSE
ncbi:TlpA family protein disulfide reductase [Duganella sp. FT135W]|uniref:TlpA family protein disulfide reductase n=1 Tax=Duganella flavida TaxID=2692175 RepID=A0A6L8K9W0_9BURK|nr:TlpA family protein disulfide reductase [Duganella flavida]MYM22604.1 TlpA family protein disulfide reductase [Duganella flavida]